MSVAVKPRANEIQLSLDLYRKANEKGMTFSQYLETIDPSSEYGPNEKLDAFERQLKRFGIVPKTDLSKGIVASKVEAFYQTQESAVLFPEFINRVAREAIMADDILKFLVAVTTPIDSDAYRTFYVQDQPEAAQKKRVAQGAELPVSELVGQENAIRLYKYGRRLKITYEAARRMRVDLLGIHVKRIMQQANIDKAEEALNVIVNGDGNNNAAVNYNKTALQGGVATDALSYKGWLAYLIKFYPYQLNTVIAGEGETIELLTMQPPNVDPLKLIEQLRAGGTSSGANLAQPLFSNYDVVYVANAPAGKLVGIDRRYALEMVTEVGSDIVETQKLISSQWNEIAISEVSGFGVLLPDARRILTLNA